MAPFRVQRLIASLVPGALAALLLSPLPHAQDAVQDGFAAAPLATAPPILPSGPFGLPVVGVVRTLSSGEAITFDGLTVRRVSADGASKVVLGALAAPAFTGCIAIDPGEAVALIGESSSGALYRVDLGGAGMTRIGALPLNFDAAFEAPGIALVSAATASGNDVVRVDVATGASELVCAVSGYSGPLALDAAGNLYYGHTDGRVLAWTAPDLASGATLGEGDAIVIADGFHGPASLAIDHVNAGVYLADSDFAAGTSTIYEVHTSLALSTPLVHATTPFVSLSGLEMIGSACGGTFAGWQPACGGTLRYAATDFATVAYRAAVRPARPTGALTGPGAGPGPGAIAFEVSGGPPLGFARVFLGPTAAFASPEKVYAFSGAQPLFTGFPLTAIDVVAGLIPLDAKGQAALATADPGGLEGLVTVQAYCVDAGGVIVGSTTAAHL